MNTKNVEKENQYDYVKKIAKKMRYLAMRLALWSFKRPWMLIPRQSPRIAHNQQTRPMWRLERQKSIHGVTIGRHLSPLISLLSVWKTMNPRTSFCFSYRCHMLIYGRVPKASLDSEALRPGHRHVHPAPVPHEARGVLVVGAHRADHNHLQLLCKSSFWEVKIDARRKNQDVWDWKFLA